jgi:hypothetical protein
MRIASIALLALFAVASFEPASAEDATFIKKPKALGSKDSTVTTYQATSGSSINCSGTCFSDGVTRHWTCKGTHADVMCQLRCAPPPPKGGCLPF